LLAWLFRRWCRPARPHHLLLTRDLVLLQPCGLGANVGTIFNLVSDECPNVLVLADQTEESFVI